MFYLAKIIEAANGFIHVNNLTEEEEPELRSREDSRRKLLEHLKTCQTVYQTEFLSKFCEAVEKFNLIVEETEQAIKVTGSHFNGYNDQLKKFVSDREVVVKLVEERKEKLNEHMKNRFFINTTGHAISLSGKFLLVAGVWFPPAFVPGAFLSVGSLIGVSSSEAFWITEKKSLYDLFEENLNKDKENREKLENLQTELKNSIGRFREIYDQFKDSEYKKQDIDKKKIEVVKKVLKKVLGEEIETNENQGEEKNHSTAWKAGRATLEALAKCAPFPNPLLGFYLAYRDYREIENRTSLSDMEKVIENWKEELKVWKVKEEPLNEEYKEIEDCQKEIEELSVRNKSQLSITSQTAATQGESKSIKLEKLVTEEPREIDDNAINQNWTNIHSKFTQELIQFWTNHNFTYSRTQEWINIGLQPTDYNFVTWLRDTKQLTSEQVLNYTNEQELRQEY